MIHLGDITKIKGCVVPVVDCVIGGSPCQDLSQAGLRKGFDGDRSVLYMEQIRVIKEMRHQDELRGRTGESVRPRYMVWENVPGAFSTNEGKDFAAVIEEAIKVVEPEAPAVHVPAKGWPTSGCFMGARWSVAWRVLDAQFWGVPQRRRRIALVADFGGQSAPEILFVRKGMSRNPEESRQERKEAAGTSQNFLGADRSGRPLNHLAGAYGWPLGFRPENIRVYEETATTLVNGTRPGFTTGVIQPILDDQGGSQISVRHDGKRPTLRAEAHGNIPCVVEPVAFDTYNMAVAGDKTITLRAGAEHNYAPVFQPLIMEMTSTKNTIIDNGICPTLTARMGTGGNQVNGITMPVTYPKVTGPLMANSHPGSYTGQDAYNDMLVAGVDCRNATESLEMNGTLHHGSYHNLNSGNAVRVRNIVRRLTPLECERLQGFPDGWTDLHTIEDMANEDYECWKAVLLAGAMREGRARENEDGVIEVWQFVDGEDEDDEGEWRNTHKPYKHKTKEQMVGWYNRMIAADSSRYKALGNSIAIPPWKWVLKRLCACYERDATMASLFDGIGGFPLIWEQINGKGSCLWASEIEEFPMAVTRVRFGGYLMAGSEKR